MYVIIYLKNGRIAWVVRITIFFQSGMSSPQGQVGSSRYSGGGTIKNVVVKMSELQYVHTRPSQNTKYVPEHQASNCPPYGYSNPILPYTHGGR